MSATKRYLESIGFFENVNIDDDSEYFFELYSRAMADAIATEIDVDSVRTERTEPETGI